MNIAIVNTVSNKSTGKIATGLQDYLIEQGNNCYFCFGYGKTVNKVDTYRIDSSIEHYWHALLCRITGKQGAFSSLATKRLIRYLKEKKVTLIYGIGLHGYYLNEKMFYDYLINENIGFVYVMVDEYPFLGKCGYSNGCTNYLFGCGNCPQVMEYPKSLFFDRSHDMYKIKEYAYGKMQKKTFVGPEYTIMAAKKSPLLKGVHTAIIDEAVDVRFYCPRDYNDITSELGIDTNRIIILCVAPLSSERKGVKYYIEVARRLEKKDNYVFVQVGYDSDDKSCLPTNYIAIGYEQDQNRLAKFYSMADLFLFPSLLDTMPNACIEALACGTPLLCFNTSGMPYLGDSSVATFVLEKSVDELVEVVSKTRKKTTEVINKCRNYAINRYDNQLYYRRLLNVGKKLEGEQ